ncbi:MAG: alpha/beta hydrolase [Verrucomicrobia bacterium]|nr:alpha/beta hydrolase [Verrucomicrobiota bacterium]
MLFGLLLASQFWLMSDRDAFWDAEKISNHTEFMQDSIQRITALDSRQLKGKNVLLLVHGYNNSPEEALSTYRLINMHLSSFKDSRRSKFYDLIIGYLWPGDDSSLEYYDAKRHVSKLAMTMRSHLEFLSASAARVDVLAHSMGNRLVLEALDYRTQGDKKVVHNLYSLAAAVDNESIEKNEKYYLSTQNCEKLFVFYSKRDDVLKWYYNIAEWDKALGCDGAEDPRKIPENVQLINYTNFIGQHSQYFTVLPIYDFIKKQFLAASVEKHVDLRHCHKEPIP